MGETKQIIDDNGSTVNHQYNVWGNKIKTEVITNNQSSIVMLTNKYDALGRVIKSVDPSAGSYCSSYNEFGDVIETSECGGTATASKTKKTYDQYGRPITTTVYAGKVIESYSEVSYLNSFSTIPKQSKQTIEIPEKTTVITTPEYDNYGRVVSTTVKVNETTYRNKVDYDNIGRMSSGYDFAESSDALDKGLSYKYADNGAVLSLTDLYDNTIYRTLTKTDAFGNVTRFSLGNGIKHQKALMLKQVDY